MVQTPANTAWLTSGRVITVLDNLSSSEEAAVQRFSSNIESAMSVLSPGDMIEVYGGPGASKEQYDQIHEENNSFWMEYGHIHLDVPTTTTAESNETVRLATPSVTNPGFAIYEETDNSLYTVQGISASMTGINIGTSQNDYSAFMVNGLTTTGFFLQSGQAYLGIPFGGQNGTCINIWSDTNQSGAHGVPFNLAYIANDNYLYDITYMGSPGVWEMGAKDETTGHFDLFVDINGTGSQFQNNPGTGVFFENWNSNTNWLAGFPATISAYYARELISYQRVNWTHENPVIQRGNIGYPNSNIISGHLIGNQTATWTLKNCLLGQ